ncbi:hypothetical protein F5878DRAFT_665976 [Lentinula raphanica]|uniref:Uncharacterized protein n=1 Tax=Lentinula raphanica TaxID=153919 RepID=A0AA38UC07_9AGAR|nr:hypothetical protein F5878DRAFT_665976 [Lentinula raphanica]
MKSYNGRVGCVYSASNIFLTSPNSNVLPEPIWGTQDVRLRKQLHFGEHDPNFNPQFFSSSRPYLPLIRIPDLDDYLKILWYFPSEADFEPIDGFKMASVPIGRFPKIQLEALEHALVTIYTRIDDAKFASSSSSSDSLLPTPTPALSTIASSLRSHPKLKEYQGRIRYLLSQLTTAAAPYSESLMIWCICQRNLLQMDAFITWALFIEPSWGKAEAWRTQPLRPVIGTITDQPLIAEQCFRAGIPVWYGRKLPVPSDIKVMHWHSNDTPLPRLFDVITKAVSFEDENPPHRIIYSGSLHSCEHYQLMADYTGKIAFPPSIFDSTLPSSSITGSSLTPTATGPSSTGQSSLVRMTPSTSSSESRSTPYSRPKKIRSKSVPSTHSRNKFEQVESSLLPPGIITWAQASSDVGKEFDHEQPPREGISRGYPLPDAVMLANLSEATRQGFLSMYLKLRELLHYRIRKLGTTASFMSNEDWRKLLGLEYLRSKEGTQAAKARQTLVKMLESLTCKNNSGGPAVEIDLSNLKNIIPQWKGQQYPNNIPDAICTEILDEIIRISFKTELLAADRYLFDPKPNIEEGLEEGEVVYELGGMSHAQRLDKIVAIPGLVTGNMGFGSPNRSNRQEAVYNLYCIMQGWGFGYGVSSKLEHVVQSLRPDREPSVSEIDTAEYHVAYHYISVFADYFKRAPTIPHRF